MSTEQVRLRREELFDYITARPHEKLTIKAIARDLGRKANGTFTMDLSVIRHWAREDVDGLITNCYFDNETMGNVLVFLPKREEQMVSARPLRTQSRQFRTRGRNLKSQASYTAQYAVRKEDRAYGKLQVAMTGAVETFLEAAESYERTMRSLTNGQ